MITLLHGDYIEASRNELVRLKEKSHGKEIRELDGRTIELSSLTQSLESTSMFGGDTVVIIERLFGKLGRQTKKIESLGQIISRASGTIDVILWEDKEVGKTVIKYLGDTVNVRLFALPVYIFQLLDGLKPDNAAALLSLYENMKHTDAPELIFSMIVKRVRQLIGIMDGGAPEGLAPWQAARLTTQAKSFTMEKLLSMYELLHTIEVHIKTGMSPFTMTELTEQFLISL
jgi:DNA polymerase III delta subunit